MAGGSIGLAGVFWECKALIFVNEAMVIQTFDSLARGLQLMKQ